jgi:hypothetical protein
MGDGLVLALIGNAEVALKGVSHEEAVLFPDRLVEAVFAIQILNDRVRQFAFAVPGAAFDAVHQREGN